MTAPVTRPLSSAADAAPTPYAAGKPFVGLDALRGAAAILVVIWHATALFGFGPASGYLAVDLFFVISGFVLAHAYDGRIAAGMTTVGFMRVRLIRLYPLYLLGVGIMTAALAAALIIGAKTNWTFARLAATLAFNLAFLPAPPLGTVDPNLYPLDVPAWSLAFEIVINVVFVALWRPLRQSGRTLALALVASIAIAILVAEHGDINLGAQWDGLAGGMARVTYSFFAGVLLRRAEFAIRRPVSGLLVVAALLLALWLPVAAAWRPVFDFAAVLVVFPLFVLVAAAARPNALAPLFTLLGRASYAVYALHVPLLALVLGVLPRLFHGHLPSGPLVGGLFVVGVFGTALLADAAYDNPVRRRLLGATAR